MINKYSKIIKRSIFLIIIFLVILFAFLIMLRYEVEGEKQLPFYINKILVMSTVNGKSNDTSDKMWHLNLSQNNDVYIYIDKQEENEILKTVTIENFNIVKSSNIGEIKVYRPTGELSNLYTQSNQNYINDAIKYTGSTIDDLKVLEISNQGGIIGFRISLENIGEYTSDIDSEVIYDGSLLSKSGISEEDIKFEISFDIILEVQKGIKYKGTININLPSENLIQNGTSRLEITDFENVVYKRIK